MGIVHASMIALLALPVCAGIAFLVAVLFPARLALRISLLSSTATFFCLLCFVWFLRDGLGPDAQTSQGLEAGGRIAAEAGFLALCWLLTSGSAFFAYRINRATREVATQK